MAVDTLHEEQALLQQQNAQNRQRNRLAWRPALFFLAMIATMAAAATIISSSLTSRETGPKLTHTITRGNLLVTLIEQGILESAENAEIKCQVRGHNTVIWVIDSGTMVKPGDELVRLDSLFIQEQIDERTKYAHWSRSSAERSAANLARSELAVIEYEQGRYVSELMMRQKDLVIARARLQSAENMLSHTRQMAVSNYTSELELEEKTFTVKQAKLDVELKETEVEVLQRFTQAEQLQTLKGDLAATKANHEANAERARADASRRNRAVEEIKHCVVKAERSGLVIHPNAAKWETAPIAEGASVHKDQVLLLMPDLSKMQVKVGIPEAIVDRIKEGLTANVALPDETLEGTVSSVASVTRPAGWWTGNVVRYDTLIQLPSKPGLRPGMSAEVEVIIARYEDVLTIPVAAIVDFDDGPYCWVKTDKGTIRRPLTLGDSNDIFTIVESGLEQGDDVVLNPLAFGEPKLVTTTTSDDPDPLVPDASQPEQD